MEIKRKIWRNVSSLSSEQDEQILSQTNLPNQTKEGERKPKSTKLETKMKTLLQIPMKFWKLSRNSLKIYTPTNWKRNQIVSYL